VLVVLAQTGTAAQEIRSDQGPVTIEVKGPVIVGFFPPFTKAEESTDEVVEGLAHIRYALERVESCYGNAAATYRIEITRSIMLRDGATVHRLGIPSDWWHSYGIVFAVPGRKPRILFGEDGPSSLMATAVAGEYSFPSCLSWFPQAWRG
jgi:hypothetical protein